MCFGSELRLVEATATSIPLFARSGWSDGPSPWRPEAAPTGVFRVMGAAFIRSFWPLSRLLAPTLRPAARR